MPTNDKPNETKVSMTKPDEIALAQFRRSINSRNAWDVSDQASYNKGEKTWDVHRKDPTRGQVVIDTFHFSSEEVANIAINHAKSMRI